MESVEVTTQPVKHPGLGIRFESKRAGRRIRRYRNGFAIDRRHDLGSEPRRDERSRHVRCDADLDGAALSHRIPMPVQPLKAMAGHGSRNRLRNNGPG